MRLPRTEFTALSVERSSPPRTDAGAFGRRTGSQTCEVLRETYPLAVISPRHELAAVDGRRVWYAFRDGSAVPALDGATS